MLQSHGTIANRFSVDLMSFFKNPMILMGVVMAAMAFGMPYLMENSKSTIIDPLHVL